MQNRKAGTRAAQKSGIRRSLSLRGVWARALWRAFRIRFECHLDSHTRFHWPIADAAWVKARLHERAIYRVAKRFAHNQIIERDVLYDTFLIDKERELGRYNS